MPCASTRQRTFRSALAALLLLLLAAPAEPRRGDLESVRREITRLRQRLEEVRREAQSVSREIEEINLQLAIRTRELELAAAAEQQLSAEQAAIETDVVRLASRIEQQRRDLRRRLVALYRLGSLSYLRIALALEENQNPFEAMSMLSYLVSRDSRLVARFQADRQQLAMRRVELAERRVRLDRTRAAVEKSRRAVLATQAQKEQVLARLRGEESRAEQRLVVLEEKARRLQRLVELLSQQKRGLDPDVDIRTVQGALAWPVHGRVTERFGRQRNPKFATFTINNGLKIEAAPGTPVRAVFQGTVLFTQWFKGYGNLIILDHGNRVFSLYGNLKGPLVAVGDRILTGQPIAGVGESEDASSGHLYFEIRHDNRPEDPQKWLR